MAGRSTEIARAAIDNPRFQLERRTAHPFQTIAPVKGSYLRALGYGKSGPQTYLGLLKLDETEKALASYYQRGGTLSLTDIIRTMVHVENVRTEKSPLTLPIIGVRSKQTGSGHIILAQVGDEQGELAAERQQYSEKFKKLVDYEGDFRRFVPDLQIARSARSSVDEAFLESIGEQLIGLVVTLNPVKPLPHLNDIHAQLQLRADKPN